MGVHQPSSLVGQEICISHPGRRSTGGGDVVGRTVRRHAVSNDGPAAPQRPGMKSGPVGSPDSPPYSDNLSSLESSASIIAAKAAENLRFLDSIAVGVSHSHVSVYVSRQPVAVHINTYCLELNGVISV